MCILSNNSHPFRVQNSCEICSCCLVWLLLSCFSSLLTCSHIFSESLSVISEAANHSNNSMKGMVRIKTAIQSSAIGNIWHQILSAPDYNPPSHFCTACYEICLISSTIVKSFTCFYVILADYGRGCVKTTNIFLNVNCYKLLFIIQRLNRLKK